jgi:hypothetical protein
VSVSTHAAPLFTENFDVNNAANWTVNNNNNGTNAANFSFNYGSVGIPSADGPGGTTVGLKLQANISGTGPASGVLPAISVSPNGQSFTGDYTVSFKWWHNFLGSTTGGIGNSAGGSGSTQISTFGVMTAGDTANYAGASDSVFFAATGDGASAQDFRAYSKEQPTGYATGITGNNAHNVYAAGSQNSSAALYQTAFPAGAQAPTAQSNAAATQTGSTLAGMAGFRWHDVVIEKAGNLITWKVNGTLFDTVDLTNFTPANLPTGSNILFGMSDTSLGAGTPASAFQTYDFTLIDNISVVPEPACLSILGLAGLAIARRRPTR